LNNVRYSLSIIKLPDVTSEELENIRFTAWKEGFEARRKKLDVDRHKKFEELEEYQTVGFKYQTDDGRRAAEPHL
jgi:hypothetical protein